MATARKSASKGSKSKAPRGAHGPSEVQPTAKPPKAAAAPKTTKSPANRAAPRKSGGAAASNARNAKAGKLTKQQTRFAVEYLKDFNATQAAIRAGYSKQTARVQGGRLLLHVAIQRLIAPKQQEQQQAEAQEVRGIELSIERTKLEIARIAYFDPRKMFDKEGRPLHVTELDDDTAAVIAGLDVLEEWEGSGEDRVLVGHVKKYKIGDKNSALDKASKILGLYERDNSQKTTPVADALAELLKGIHQAGGSTMPVVAKRVSR